MNTPLQNCCSWLFYCSLFTILSTTPLKVSENCESGNALTAERKSLDSNGTRTSIGSEPKMSMFVCLANAAPPSEEKIVVQVAQFGQVNPLIFSTMPRILSPVLLQNVISLRTSSSAISCGVVTMTTPLLLVWFVKSVMHSITVMCSSDVPGGVSITK